jgi:hypothetical protein
MSGIPCRSHAWTVVFLTAGLAVLPIDLARAATAPASDTAAQPPIQRPGERSAEPEETAPSSEAAEAAVDERVDEVPEAPVMAEPEPAEPAEATPELDPGLLDAQPERAPATQSPPPTLRAPTADPDAEEAALARSYDAAYRPASNPGRLNLGVRTLFANAGGGDRVGGRMGGVQVDVGQSFNRLGYAITAQAWGGRVVLDRETHAEMNAMFGVGPTLNLGRLALQGNGFLDLRVGYDFFYGVVNQRRDDPAIVSPQADPDLQLVQAQNLIPHGPRAQLNMGLLMSSSHRRFFHGLGVSAGYQGLVHSFRGDLPYTHMLTLGLSYWMG